MITRLLPDDDGRVCTRFDGFVLTDDHIDDDGPLVVPSRVAREIMKNMPAPAAEVDVAMMTRAMGHFDRVAVNEWVFVTDGSTADSASGLTL